MAKKKELGNINSGRMEDFLSPANRHELPARPVQQAAAEARMRRNDAHRSDDPWGMPGDFNQWERDHRVLNRVNRQTSKGGSTRDAGTAFE